MSPLSATDILFSLGELRDLNERAWAGETGTKPRHSVFVLT